MVPLELVVAQTVAAIERRAAMTVIPKRVGPVARAAGLARPLIDRIGWPGNTIEQTIELVGAPAGKVARHASEQRERV
jgi:hypothetical protein